MSRHPKREPDLAMAVTWAEADRCRGGSFGQDVSHQSQGWLTTPTPAMSHKFAIGEVVVFVPEPG
jgi:hypothetical protein